MKSIRRVGFGVATVLASAAAVLACQNDDSVPNNPLPGYSQDAGEDGEAGTTSLMGDATVTPDTGSSAEAGSAGDGGQSDAGAAGDAAVLSCTAYCQAVMSACTGANAQYLSMDECMTACPLLPLGTPGSSTGNTIACRLAHAGFAVTQPVPHCWHAGPFGYGQCGTECESFCTLATSFCSPDGGFDGGAPPYASSSDCTTACASFAVIDDKDGGGVVGVDGGYNAAGPMGGNTLDCREWHLDNALAGPGQANGQEFHCLHIGKTSPTCM